MKTYVPKSTDHAKQITAVSPTARDGYGYEGEFLTSEYPLDADPGFVVLSVDKTWHKKRGHSKSAGIYVLLPDGAWWALCTAEGMDWAFKMREEAIAVLAMTPDQRLAKAIPEHIAEMEKDEKSTRDTAERNRADDGELSEIGKLYVTQADEIAAKIATLRAWKPAADTKELRAEDHTIVSANPLAGFSTDDLIAELKRRGVHSIA